MPIGEADRVDAAVAEEVYQEYRGGAHDGAYRRYLERMQRQPGSPMVCNWLDFCQWWLDRQEREEVLDGE